MTTTASTQITSRPRRAGRARRLAATALATAAVAAVAPMASAAANTPPLPTQTHCPVGFLLVPISGFASVYQDWLATVVDGNHDGYVCSRQLPDAVAQARDGALGLPPGSPIYLVGDDQTTP